MPSRFEPCGLNQMYSQRYGTVPVVHNTGGLADSVTDVFASAFGAGTGLVVEAPEVTALAAALDRGLPLYRNRAAWLALQRNAMAADLGWQRSAEAYLEVYRRALATVGGDHG